MLADYYYAAYCRGMENETTKQMSHAEITKHIRSRIKKAGIKASVRKMVICGTPRVSVSVASYNQNFTLDEQKMIKRIARVNGATLIRGIEVEDTVPFGNECEFFWDHL
jgi:hypothetical protein